MGRTVMKAGGGILKDSTDFRRVAEITGERLNKDGLVLVLSAANRVTESLIKSAERCCTGELKAEDAIRALRKRHVSLLESVPDPAIKKEAKNSIEIILRSAHPIFQTINATRELSPNTLDIVQHLGERLSPPIMNAFLKHKGIPARIVDAEEAGIVCKGDFGRATIDVEQTSRNLIERVLPDLDGRVIMLPGFYGIDSSGHIKTIGRGGGDYSAGVFANIFDANLVLWKDVHFMTADPQAVNDAKRILSLTYDEGELLGYLGAKILHPKTIPPLRDKGLTLEVKNVHAPKEPGTIISCKSGDTSAVKSITSRDEVLVTVKSDEMVDTPGYAAAILAKVAEKMINVGTISTSSIEVSFGVEPRNARAAIAAVKELQDVYDMQVSSGDRSQISLVGSGMKGIPGISGRLFAALGNAGINVKASSQPDTETSITVLVRREDREAAIKAAHTEFIRS